MSEVKWVTDIKAALERGVESYKAAAQMIEAAMKTHNLKQKNVATKIGRSATWVCRLLQWYRAGYSEETVFGGEIAHRRKIATSQSKRFRITKSEMGQGRFPFEGAPARNYRPGETQAGENAQAIGMACHQLTSYLKNLKPTQIDLVMASSSDARRRGELEKLATRLEEAIRAAQRLAKALRVELARPTRPSPKRTSTEQRIH